MRRRWFIAISLLLAFSLSSLDIVSSQSQIGIINGTVKDPNGAALVGAKATVRNEATGETLDTITDNQGRFKVESLAPGGYKITINQGGFKTSERAISIESGKTTTVEIKLEIAETRVEVTVPTKGPRPRVSRRLSKAYGAGYGPGWKQAHELVLQSVGLWN